MGNKKNIVVAAVLAMLSMSLSGANAENINSLLQMDVKKASVADTVDVTFYTTGDSTNSVVTRKANNRYVVLLPNISGSGSVAPGIGGVKDLITNIEVKHVNDGIGGYTKVTFETTKPVNIKTHMKKTQPLTQAQKDYKTIIAQNNAKPAQTTTQNKVQQTTKPVQAKQPVKQAAVKPVVSAGSTNTPAKPVNSQAKTAQKISTPQLTPVEVPKTQKQTPKPKPQQSVQQTVQTQPKIVQQVQQKLQPKESEQKKVQTSVLNTTDGYVPKMKFDENGRRTIDLEPRVSHTVVPEKPAKSLVVDPLFAVDNSVNTQIQQPETQIEETPVAAEIPQPADDSSTTHFPMWILAAGGSVLALGVMYLVFDALSHASEKDQARLKSFFSLSSKNQAKRRRREYYDIVNNEELSWQEKYKLYTEKEEKRKIKKSSMDMSYVTDMSGVKKAIVTPEKEEQTSREQNSVNIQQPSGKAPALNLNHLADSIQNIPKDRQEELKAKMQAKISQMEHALAQTPKTNEPEEISTGVKSEDDAIMNKFSDIKLKTFSKPLTLKQTQRSLAEDDKKASRNKSYKEGRFVKLKNSPLSVSRRKSAASNLEVSDLIGTGSKYLTNNGEMKMNKENENYLLSSLDEYLSILDSEEKSATATVAQSSIADTLSQIRTSSPVMSRSGVTNPIARGSNPISGSKNEPAPYMNGLIVKSGYNIDSEKGFYVVNIDGVSALVGRIKDSIFILKKFDHVVDKPIQVRPDDANVYIVKVGRFKCLVDVSKDKMGTLIEI